MDQPVALLLERARRARAEEGLPAFALALRRGDEVLLDVVEGAREDARFVTFSASKGVVSGVVAALLADGTLDPAQRVGEVLPWFTGDGRDAIAVEHLLLHTAGLATAPMRPEQALDAEARRDRMASWRPAHPPGEAFAYHATSAHWLLGEVLAELTGVPLHDLVERHVAGPLGLADLSLGTDVADPRFQPVVAVGRPTPDELVARLAAAGIDLRAAVGESAVDHLVRFNEQAVMDCRMPAAMVVSTARDLAAYYAALARRDPRLAPPAVVADVTSTIRNDLPDRVFGGTAGRSLGFVVAGTDGDAVRRGLPPGCSAATFGQPGTTGQIGWADPEGGLAFAFLTSGAQVDPLVWFQRMAELNALAAACA